MAASQKGARFDWASLVSHLVHPAKVAIIEAMEWVDVPVSPRELELFFDEQWGVSLLSYHMRTLADVGAVKRVSQTQVRGAVQNFYVLSMTLRDPSTENRDGS